MKKYSLTLWHHFLSELAWMIQHGIPLQAALNLLTKQHRLKPLHPFLFHCMNATTQGFPLSHALSISPQSYLFQAFLICGEKSGSIAAALAQAAEWVSHLLQCHTQGRSLAFYPLLLILLLIGGSGLLLGMIVPTFHTLYLSFNAPLPASMTLLWAAHVFFSQWGVLVFMLIVLLISIFIFACRFSSSLQLLLHRWALRIPLIRHFHHGYECAHLGMLLSAGISLDQSFQCVLVYTRNRAHQHMLHRILETLTQGQPLAYSYRALGWHDAYLCDMLNIAEHTGTLASLLKITYVLYSSHCGTISSF